MPRPGCQNFLKEIWTPQSQPPTYLLLRNPLRTPLAENITRRRFIKRPGVATVAGALAFNAFVAADGPPTGGSIPCIKFTFSLPSNSGELCLNSNMTTAQIRAVLKAKNATFTEAACTEAHDPNYFGYSGHYQEWKGVNTAACRLPGGSGTVTKQDPIP